MLLKNIHESKLQANKELQARQEVLIKEVHLLLRRDDLEWKQIKNQVHYKLQNLKNLDRVHDFTADLDELDKLLESEAAEREQDD